MNYKVLYRKYRPDNFEDLVGQDSIKQILKNSINNNKIAHAYIFSGPRGTGKTSTAKIFAKSVNCLNNNNGEACGKCVNCLNFNTNTDIIEIDAASNNGVDQIREITNNLKLAPSMSKYKVYIIDEVHMLSISAFNALLLTLEEPPSHVIFILATTNIENVPLTILSRCQKFDFKKISNKNIIEKLTVICKKEQIEIEENALTEIAYISDGGLRDALGLLDQLSKDNKKITLENVISEVGSVSFNNIEKLMNAVNNNEIETILNIISDFRNYSLDYKLIIKKIIDYCVQQSEYIIANGNTKRLLFKDYKNIVFDLTDCLNKINVNVDSYYLIELILLNYVQLTEKNLIKNDNVIKNDEVKKTKKIVKKFNEERLNNCFVEATKDDKNFAIKIWNELLENENHPEIKGLLLDTEVVMASKNIFIIMVSTNKLDDFNEKLDKISIEITKKFNLKIKLLALDSIKWKNASEKYINDLKNGIKYTLRNEIEEENKPSEIENLAKNLFSKEKIEID